jgi:hypothetical protein
LCFHKARHTSMASVHWHQYAGLKFPDAQPWYQSTISLCASRAEWEAESDRYQQITMAWFVFFRAISVEFFSFALAKNVVA